VHAKLRLGRGVRCRRKRVARQLQHRGLRAAVHSGDRCWSTTSTIAAQVDTYAGLNGWDVRDIFGRSAETIAGLQASERAKHAAPGA